MDLELALAAFQGRCGGLELRLSEHPVDDLEPERQTSAVPADDERVALSQDLPDDYVPRGRLGGLDPLVG